MEKRRGEYIPIYLAIHIIGLAALALAFSKETKKEVWKRCGGRCEGCGESLKPGNKKLHHITPLNLKGTDNLDNAEYLCLKCESERHKEIYEIYGDKDNFSASIMCKKRK